MTTLVPVHDSGYWLTFQPGEQDRLALLTATWLMRRTVNTRAAYALDLGRWVGWCQRCGVTPLTARMVHMDGWITWQRTQGANGDDKPSAEASIGRRVAAISSWYKYVQRNTKDDPEPLAARNPADTDARPEVEKDYSTTIGLSTAEADQLIRQADLEGTRTAALIRTLLYLGLRCGSAVDADIEDLGHERGYRTLSLRMKGGKRRRAPIPAALSEAIDAMLADRGGPAEGPLFATSTGKRLDRTYVLRLVRRVAREAGISSAEQLSAHSLRHTFATDALDAGASLRDLQDAMGHADPRTTRRYDRARNNLDRHPAHLLAARFGMRQDA